MRRRSSLVWWLGLLVGLVVGFLAWAFPNRRLAPTGPHPVRTRSWVLTDPERLDPFADRAALRRFPVQAWFPADAPPGPVILLVHGLRGRRRAYTTYARELASHGYTVVAADHPPVALWPSFPEGRGAPSSSVWRALMRLASQPSALVAHPTFRLAHEVVDGDLDLILHDLPSRLGLDRSATERVLLMGHSFGGSVALSKPVHPAVAGIVSLDGPPFREPPAPVGVPVLLLRARTRVSPRLSAVWAPIDRVPELVAGPLHAYDLPTIGHLELSDFGLIVNPAILRRIFGPAHFGPGPLEPKLRAVAAITLAFADRYVREDPSADPDAVAESTLSTLIQEGRSARSRTPRSHPPVARGRT